MDHIQTMTRDSELEELCNELSYGEVVKHAENQDEEEYIRNYYGIPTIKIDGREMAKMVKDMATKHANIQVYGKKAHFNKLNQFEVLTQAKFQDVEYANGQIYTWFDHEDTINVKDRDSAKYIDILCMICITWDLDIESVPEVEIEIETM